MVKVAILTLSRVENYGAALQAYALQQTIAKFGLNCEIIDLLRPQHPGYKIMPMSEKFCIGIKAKSILTQGDSKIKNTLKKLKRKAFNTLDQLLRSKSHQEFNLFNQKHLKFSPFTYQCEEDLYNAKLDYDAYVTGSDQVWNPTSSWNPEPFFLNFVSPDISRIAYAPSFGVESIDETLWPIYKKWLQNITHLSVREVDGAEIVRKIAHRSATVVLDPTLLLADYEWKKLAKEPLCKQPYIFCYTVGEGHDVMNLCYHVQRLTKYPIYKIRTSNQVVKDVLNWRINAIRNAGPQEFLGYLMNAAVVITNSFHGTVLSINMQKPFFTVPLSATSKNSRNSRLFSILKILSATDRIYSPDSELPSINDIALNYNPINNKLELERVKSMQFLKNSIFD